MCVLQQTGLDIQLPTVYFLSMATGVDFHPVHGSGPDRFSTEIAKLPIPCTIVHDARDRPDQVLEQIHAAVDDKSRNRLVSNSISMFTSIIPLIRFDK
jgi:hypothetical protein